MYMMNTFLMYLIVDNIVCSYSLWLKFILLLVLQIKFLCRSTIKFEAFLVTIDKGFS